MDVLDVLGVVGVLDMIEKRLNKDCLIEVLLYLDCEDIEKLGVYCSDEKVWKLLVYRDFVSCGVFVSNRMVRKCGGWYGIYNCLRVGMRWKDFLGN